MKLIHFGILAVAVASSAFGVTSLASRDLSTESASPIFGVTIPLMA
jgi:hypothetical protein